MMDLNSLVFEKKKLYFVINYTYDKIINNINFQIM